MYLHSGPRYHGYSVPPSPGPWLHTSPHLEFWCYCHSKCILTFVPGPEVVLLGPELHGYFLCTSTALAQVPQILLLPYVYLHTKLKAKEDLLAIAHPPKENKKTPEAFTTEVTHNIDCWGLLQSFLMATSFDRASWRLHSCTSPRTQIYCYILMEPAPPYPHPASVFILSVEEGLSPLKPICKVWRWLPLKCADISAGLQETWKIQEKWYRQGNTVIF